MTDIRHENIDLPKYLIAGKESRRRGRAMAHILVVDDEPTVCRAFARLLRSEGHEAWCAYGGSDALAHLGAHQPDLIVLDLMMPGLDGFAVLEALRQQPSAVPVVAYTALDDQQTRRRVIELGAKQLIRKGMPWEEVYQHLVRHL
jgi:two-component system OmpR family response regulator